MKLKIVLLALVGAAGATASYALADSGHHGRVHAKADSCSRAVVFGTAAPQSFTVTVKHAGPHSQFKTGDVVTVMVGGQGQNVGVTGFGCANGSTLQASAALLRVRFGGDHGTTTETTTTQSTTTGDHGKGRGHHDPHGGTTTTTTTTSATTTAETTTAETTTADTTTGETTTSSNNDTSNGL